VIAPLEAERKRLQQAVNTTVVDLAGLQMLAQRVAAVNGIDHEARAVGICIVSQDEHSHTAQLVRVAYATVNR